MKSVISLPFICCLALPVQAQKIDLTQYEIGLGAGVMVYQGDLTPEPPGAYKTMRFYWALQVYRKLGNAFAVRLNFSRGRLYADEGLYSEPDWRRQRNFIFSTPVTELAGQLVWYPLAARAPRLSPYVFGGAGLSFVGIKRDWSNMNTTVFGDGSEVQAGLAEDLTVDLPRRVMVIPAGAGARYMPGERWSIIAETSFRFGFTDYLDGFSKSANPARNDHYHTHSVGLIYSFRGKDRRGCPVMRY